MFHAAVVHVAVSAVVRRTLVLRVGDFERITSETCRQRDGSQPEGNVTHETTEHHPDQWHRTAGGREQSTDHPVAEKRKKLLAVLTFLLCQKTCETVKPRLILIICACILQTPRPGAHTSFQLKLLLGFLSTTSDSISLLLLLSVSISICQCLRMSLTTTVDCTAHEECQHALLGVILDASQRDELR